MKEKANLQQKLLDSLADHIKTVKEVLGDPEFSNEHTSVQFAVKLYAKTLEITESNWKKVFDGFD